MKYTHLLPFMNKEDLKKLAFQVINKEIQGVKLVMILPFLGRENMDEVVDLLIEKKDAANLKTAIPFMSREKVQKLYEAAEKGEIEGFNPRVCIPFLDSAQVKKIFDELIKKASSEAHDEEDEDEDIDDLDDEDDEEEEA
jgi:hypothetical protein